MKFQENLDPMPKNPIIANSFTQMGRSEELGSGVRNLYKCSLLYTGRLPKMSDGGTLNTEAVKKETLAAVSSATVEVLAGEMLLNCHGLYIATVKKARSRASRRRLAHMDAKRPA